MEKIFNKNILLKVTTLLLCFYLAIVPFFQPKKVQASLLIASASVVAGVVTAMVAAGYVHYTSLTPEQMNEMNEKATANLKEAYPNATDYDNQVNIIYNLEKDLLAGKDIDWSKYSGKALYAVLKGVVDVVWPFTESDFNKLDGYTLLGSYGSYLYYVKLQEEYTKYGVTYHKLPYFPVTGWHFTEASAIHSQYANNNKPISERYASFDVQIYNGQKYVSYVSGFSYYAGASFILQNQGTSSLTDSTGLLSKFLGHNPSANCIYKPSLKQTLPNKVKLPTRLPQTVINNINNYYNGDIESLIINPTPEELPILPDNYNPNTDELPDLPGYVDVTPDQEPTTDPEPTPTPPDPTPTPPEYNGDEWVNPIGNFFDGLLKFMKAAFVPTLSLDLSALSNMPENFTDKFPFSLPSDIVSIFGVINAEPVAPSFSFTFPLSYVGGEDMDASFNLDNFNDAAAVIRSLLLLVVVVLLAWKTYGLVGGDS